MSLYGALAACRNMAQGLFSQLRWGPLAGTGHIPTDEMEMATHLYLALQAFFRRYEDLQQRPFIITGVRPAQPGTSRAVAVAGRADCQGQHVRPDQRLHVALRTCSAPTNVASGGLYLKYSLVWCFCTRLP